MCVCEGGARGRRQRWKNGEKEGREGRREEREREGGRKERGREGGRGGGGKREGERGGGEMRRDGRKERRKGIW